MNMLEDLVGFPAPAPSFPPTLDDAPVVAKDSEELAW